MLQALPMRVSVCVLCALTFVICLSIIWHMSLSKGFMCCVSYGLYVVGFDDSIRFDVCLVAGCRWVRFGLHDF